MPSRKPTRKPARRRSKASIEPHKWLWVVCGVNIFAGMAFSPLTAVRRVRVVGADSSDHARLAQSLQSLKGVPVLRVSKQMAESAALENSLVKSASLSTNLFGSAVLRVRLRTPVAKIKGPSLGLDENGVLFRYGSTVANVTVLDLPASARRTSLTLVSGWQPGQIAHLCQLLAAQVPNVDWSVELNDRGVISLQADSGADVVLGSSEGLPQKIEKLKELVLANPDLLKSVRQVNLTFPGAPMVVR